MNEIRDAFPGLEQEVNGRRVVYLDNAATTQVAQPVMNAVYNRIVTCNANVHRGIHQMSEMSTREYEAARQTVARYLNVNRDEVVFTSGTTQSVALVASSLGRTLMVGDLIVATVMEHHSNFVPWQQICRERNANFEIVPIDRNGNLDESALIALLEKKPRLLAVTQCSNVTGAWNDVAHICRLAHEYGVEILVDGAQGIAHSHPDLHELDCDYYCFSAHKIWGLTGTGILYAKRSLMSGLYPLQFGGGMVKSVTEKITEFEQPPHYLEAGTPNFVGATALAEALKFRMEYGETKLFAESQHLLKLTEQELLKIPRITVLGQTKRRSGSLSFVVDGAHPFDIAVLLDKKGIAVRSGHHCSEPFLHALGYEYALRVSPSCYNTEEEIDYFIKSLRQILQLLLIDS